MGELNSARCTRMAAASSRIAGSGEVDAAWPRTRGWQAERLLGRMYRLGMGVQKNEVRSA